jgi:ABC-type bacteriocin/lantibiotic exporter with double-glycine peptidase domain
MKSSFAVLLSLTIMVTLSGCTNSPDRIDPVAGVGKLTIPDRNWDPQRPDPSVGWCGEACIQMALSYYGREISQREINQAGQPKHPDLYAGDMDRALRALGVTFTSYDQRGNVSTFIAWIQQQFRAGFPVICGCKVYPDEHPDWSLDHFVLVVGFNAEGLWLNTQLDMSGQVLVSYAQLSSRRNGYSFENRDHRYFGRAITGLGR